MSGQPRLSKRAVWKAVRRFMVGADGISGAAMVEFTIFAPMLLTIAIYTMDFGLLIFSKMEVQNAAQAGIQYAIMTNGYDSAAISTAVTSATKFTAINPTSSQFCGCPTATATAVKFCSAACNTCSTATCSLSSQGSYVTVTATPKTAYKSFIPYGLVGKNSYNISATSTVRIK
jgi:Flp pilus assembly protein TadG